MKYFYNELIHSIKCQNFNAIAPCKKTTTAWSTACGKMCPFRPATLWKRSKLIWQAMISEYLSTFLERFHDNCIVQLIQKMVRHVKCEICYFPTGKPGDSDCLRSSLCFRNFYKLCQTLIYGTKIILHCPRWINGINYQLDKVLFRRL